MIFSYFLSKTRIKERFVKRNILLSIILFWVHFAFSEFPWIFRISLGEMPQSRMHILLSWTYLVYCFYNSCWFHRTLTRCVNASPGNLQVVMETTLAQGPLLRWTGVSFQTPCIPVWHQPGYHSDFIKGPDEGQHRNPRQSLELYDCFQSTHLMA